MGSFNSPSAHRAKNLFYFFTHPDQALCQLLGSMRVRHDHQPIQRMETPLHCVASMATINRIEITEGWREFCALLLGELPNERSWIDVILGEAVIDG
jgi:hypothetical protein